MHPAYRGIRAKFLTGGGSGCPARRARTEGCSRWVGRMVAYREWCGVPGVLLPAERTAARRWWGSNRIEWRSKGGPGGWSVQSARRNDRLSARYVPSRYHEPRFTNVVHCYVLEKYRRSTLLAARTRARPPLVTYVVDVVLTAAEASYIRLNGRRPFWRFRVNCPGQLSMVDLRGGTHCSLHRRPSKKIVPPRSDCLCSPISTSAMFNWVVFSAMFTRLTR